MHGTRKIYTQTRTNDQAGLTKVADARLVLLSNLDENWPHPNRELPDEAKF